MSIQAPTSLTDEETVLLVRCAEQMLHAMQLDGVVKMNEYGKLVIDFKPDRSDEPGVIAAGIAEVVNALAGRELVYGRIYNEKQQFSGLTEELQDFVPGMENGVDLATNARFVIGPDAHRISLNILLPERFTPREWAAKMLQIALERAQGNSQDLGAVQKLKAEVSGFEWPSEKQAADEINRANAASMAEAYFLWRMRRAFPAVKAPAANYAMNYDPPALFIYFLTVPDNHGKVEEFAEALQNTLGFDYLEYTISFVNEYDNVQLQVRIDMEPEALLENIKKHDRAGFDAAMTREQFRQRR